MLISELYHRNPKTIAEDVSIRVAVQRMEKEGLNGFVVVEKKTKRVIGVLSLQDIASAILPKEFKENIGMAKALFKKGFFHDRCKEIMAEPISTIMRKSFTSVTLEDNILTIIADFLENDLYIVPVVNKGKLVGIITRTEIKRALAIGMDV